MASLPTFSVNYCTLQLQPHSSKHPNCSLLTQKITNISYKKSHTITQLNGNSVPVRSLEFLEPVKEGTKIETSCYVPLLQECIHRNSISEVQILHAHIIKTGTHQDPFVMTFLVNVYTKCGTMEEAERVFNNLPRIYVAAWTTLMTGYVQNSQPELAIRVFLDMLEAGDYPTHITLGTVLNACSSMKSIKLGNQIHAYIAKYCIEDDTSVGNSLCSLYSNCGSLVSAIKAFRRIREKNVISWTTVICACGENGEAFQGLKFFVQMLAEDIEFNEFTLTSILSMCSTMLSLCVGVQVHSLIIKLGYESNLRIRNSVMYLYLRCGSVYEARKLFDGTQSVSLVTWNSVIAGHAQMIEFAKDDLSAHHCGAEALNMFLKLNRSGMKPDLYTFSSVLTVCSKLVALQQGEQVHAQILKTGFLSDVVVGTALVNMYNKCGSIERASKAFVEMSTRTLISWTSMITGFANHGHNQQALHLFEDMLLVGVRPNQITFVGVLSACSNAGMVHEALNYFDMMQKDYKIRPVPDHFVCLIDMFVRLGRLEEALDFIKRIEFEPNEVIWSFLVEGCRRHGNMELGFYAVEQLLKLKPKNPETYLMLLDMYLSARRWEDVFRVKSLMEEEKIRKIQDWSWINIKEKVHAFKPNDRLHPRSAEMYKLLDELLDKAESLGYKSRECFELIDEDDEIKTFSSAVYHSEKLAVAFGILNTLNAAPIIVIKNTTMCRDCHNFIKVISSVTGRVVIVRDSKRLHRFVDRQCSCGDFGFGL
ncbi:hypothetical protein Dsin_002995 [Dipteronia sinensis]|uniref:DYW domain-containing protein n=1 Tax=Dipteronia sinensis TaxID=43782 RepID=A0AAE0EK75_9ROSI|nr:hypothetical protein Dsin_002995 [Dipteronia sinensis]